MLLTMEITYFSQALTKGPFSEEFYPKKMRNVGFLLYDNKVTVTRIPESGKVFSLLYHLSGIHSFLFSACWSGLEPGDRLYLVLSCGMRRIYLHTPAYLLGTKVTL
jgi:hypothetical protein